MMKTFYLLLSFFLPSAGVFAQQDFYLLIGTYTQKTDSKGIYVYRFNERTGDFEMVSTAGAVVDPSYLAVSPDEKFVYAVNETNDSRGTGGGISAFRFDKQSGKLEFINRVYSGGDHPCYVSVHPLGRFVAAANYTSGSLAVMPVKENGGLGNPVSIIQHYGGGPNKKRQAGPHVHSAVFSADGKFLCAADLGTDTETLYAFDSNNGHLDTVPFQTIHTRPGTGPRHFIYSDNGKYAYLVTEMGGSISAYQVKRGRLKLMQELSALPDGFKGNNTSADLHISPDGTFLYMTNRGKESNSITTFKIDQRSGQLQKTGYQPTLGNFPRNFVISPGGRYLLVAHQLSNDIVVFERNSITGQLTDTGKRIAIPAPVCLKWINR